VGFFFLRKIDEGFFHIAISLITVIGTLETVKMTGEKTATIQKAVCVIASAAICTAFYFAGVTGALIALITSLIVQFFIPVFARAKYSLESLALSLFASLYPSALLIPLMMMNTLGGISTFALILTFVISPCADVFAYLVGRTLKGKKLCPEISPNKTISGAIGGLVGGIVGSIVVYLFTKNSFTYTLNINPFVFFAALGLVAALLTEIGDLVESFVKRSFNVKDSGKIFPGHGGVLDRFDGLIFASVLIYFVVALF
jgi:phosphatidate cytidylyltransferase